MRSGPRRVKRGRQNLAVAVAGRRQALAWLLCQLDAWEARLEHDRVTAENLHRVLEAWTSEPAFSSVRNEGVTALPDGERSRCLHVPEMTTCMRLERTMPATGSAGQRVAYWT